MRLGSIAASALNAFSVAMQVHAHNIANVSTNDFVSQEASFMTGPHDQGVTVVSVYTANTPFSPQPSGIFLNENGREIYAAGAIEENNLDIGHEFARMIASQRAFEANAAVIRTSDDISGAFLNLKV